MTKIAPRPQWQLDCTASGSGELLARRGKNRERTADEVAYQSRVADLGCICCRLLGVPQLTNTEIHHVRRGRLRADCHYDVLPLCNQCHRGRFSIHGDKSILRQIGKSENELLDIVRGMV